MDFVLVSITALSLILAIAMGVVLFTVLREDRQRSDARVAALARGVGQSSICRWRIVIPRHCASRIPSSARRTTFSR